MTDLGIVGSPSAWPDAAELRTLGARVVRSLVIEADPFVAWVHSLEGTVPVVALVEGQTAGIGLDADRLAAFAVELCSRAPLLGVEMLNEADLGGVPVEVTAAITAKMAPALAALGVQPILTSVAGPYWQTYLPRLVEALPPAVRDVCWSCLHPYGQRAAGFPSATLRNALRRAWRSKSPPLPGPLASSPIVLSRSLLKAPGVRPPAGHQYGWGFGELGEIVLRAHELSGMPVAITESGIKVGDAGGPAGQATYVGNWIDTLRPLGRDVVPLACYFCYQDSNGAPGEQGAQAFGLRDQDYQPRPAWHTYADKLGGALVEDDGGFVLGFAAMYRAAPDLVGQRIGAEPQFPPVPGLHVAVATSERGTLFWTKAQSAASATTWGEVMMFIRRDGETFLFDPATRSFRRP